MSRGAKGADLLAVDLGTQSLRLVAYDDAGHKRWTWSAPVDSHIHGDIFEQSSAQWASLLMQGMALAQQAGLRPVAMAAAGPLAGYVPLGADGQALGQAIMYPDRRAARQAQLVTAALRAAGNDHGLRVHPADPLPQWLDFVVRQPDMARRTRHFLDATGWLNYFLCGQATLNPYTGMRLYDNALRDALDANHAPFGRIVDVGQVIGELRPELAARFGFDRVPVIAAAFDSKCAYHGAGLASPGEAVDISGTVSSLGVWWPAPVDDPQRRIYSVPFAGQHLIRGSTAAAGSSLEWACHNLLSAPYSLPTDPAALERWAADAPPGANGLTFLPYLSGERTPLWNPWASGAMLGLRLTSSPADLARAVYEGLAFSVGHIVAVMCEHGVALRSLRLAGGLARSPLLAQIKADMLGVPVAPYTDHELTAQGLACIMAVAVGQATDGVQASRRFTSVRHWIEPQASTRDAHRDAFQRYRLASSSLLPLFNSVPGH